MRLRLPHSRSHLELRLTSYRLEPERGLLLPQADLPRKVANNLGAPGLLAPTAVRPDLEGQYHGLVSIEVVGGVAPGWWRK